MNTELREMMVKAEGRFLRNDEIERVRAWAQGMRGRIDIHDRIRSAEDGIVGDAAKAFVELHPEMAQEIPHFEEKVQRDLRLFVRYVAHCAARDDLRFFRRAYAEWIAELLSGMTDPDVLISGYEAVKVAAGEHLDPGDASLMNTYVDLFLTELESQK